MTFYSHRAYTHSLLEWNETRRVSGTDTWSSVFDRFISDTEFTQIMTNHFRFDFDLVEGLSVVDTDNTSNHLWYNQHITQMSLYNRWFLTKRNILLGFTQFSNQSHRFTLQPSVNASTSAGMQQSNQLQLDSFACCISAYLIGLHVQQLFQFDTAESEFFECSSFALLFVCHSELRKFSRLRQPNGLFDQKPPSLAYRSRFSRYDAGIA